jgi:hypothetical protein
VPSPARRPAVIWPGASVHADLQADTANGVVRLFPENVYGELIHHNCQGIRILRGDATGGLTAPRRPAGRTPPPAFVSRCCGRQNTDPFAMVAWLGRAEQTGQDAGDEIWVAAREFLGVR